MTRSDDQPRTRLLPRRDKDPHDAKVLDVVDGLPAVERDGRRVLVGISNSGGNVYRQVELFGTVEFILFAARMNAAGFAYDGGARARKASYDAIFRRVGRRVPRA